jgi:hypothetical protein
VPRFVAILESTALRALTRNLIKISRGEIMTTRKRVGWILAGMAAELREDSLWQGRERGKEKLYLVPLGTFPRALEPANDELLERRLRKIVLKNIGILHYCLPTNYNPNSVLYDEVYSVEDIYNMGENL